MSWFGDLEQKLENKVSDGIDSVKDGLGMGSSEEVAPTQFRNTGEVPPVAADQAQKPPSPSQRAYDQHDEVFYASPHQEQREDRAAQAGAWSHEAWVTNPSDSGLRGDQAIQSMPAPSKEQIYDAISAVAANLPHAFKCMMASHAFIEQKGGKCINWNYAGMEGGARATVLAWTTADIPTAQAQAGLGTTYKESPYFPIDKQLKDNPERKSLIVLMQKPRPAYGSLNEATAAFVHEIERRVQALQSSTNESHRELAEAAIGGDAHAYAKIVSTSFTLEGVKDAKGNAKRVGAYNDHKNYEDDVLKSIEDGQQELAKKDTAAP